MQVVYQDGVFKCEKCTFEDRIIPKEAGFFWDANEKIWFTAEPRNAVKLQSYLDNSAKKEIDKHCIKVSPWHHGLAVPKDEKLFPFQIEACLFSLSRNRSYLGLEPGLGKTICAGVIAQSIQNTELTFCLYICPPFLTRNTDAEIHKWAPDFFVSRWDMGSSNKNFNFLIIPDSIIDRPKVRDEIKSLVKAASKRGALPLLFVDEAHRFKNDEAKRTQSLYGDGESKWAITSLFEKVVLLSGTPMPNRPIELFAALNALAPETIHFMPKHEYGVKYCGAFDNGWGWDYSGASNMKALASQVHGTFLLRKRKTDVLKELEPKSEEMVVLNESIPPRLTKLSRQILNELSSEDLLSSKIHIKLDLGEDLLYLSTYRRELGMLKTDAGAEFIKFILDETDENVLVFAIHKEVISTLASALSKFSPLVVTGDTRMELRHEYVKQFQNDKTRRLFIGNIQAAGTGLTLTKATRVVFVEFSWVPADNDQASDRAHRIGQLGNVLVQYLVFENSVDKAVIETVLRKKKITAHI